MTIKEKITVKDETANLLSELRYTLGKLEIALGAIDYAIVWTDESGFIEWCNSTFDKLVSKSHIEVLGIKLFDILPLQKNNGLLIPDINNINLQTSFSGTYEFIKDNKKVILEISTTQAQISKTDKCIVFTIQDVTERNLKDKKIKLLTEQLEEKNKELIKREKILESILEDLKESEDKLKKAKKALEVSNKELEQFAYVASHDLQEPLRMVSSFTSLLEDEYKNKLDENAKEYINFAVDGAKRMQNLISDLLEYSRVGIVDEGFKEVDLNILLKDAINNLTGSIKESKAEVTSDLLPGVYGNDLRLTQLFQNLIGNAIKYRSEKIPEIQISTKQNNDEWIFSVTDNGIGIDPKHSERIFQIFQRLHGKDKYKGTGIGLALCKKIVEQHKGKIWVESESGKGSTFYFTLQKRLS